MESVAAANQEAIEAWNGVLFDRFSQFRDVILPALTPHSEAALRTDPPRRGDRVLDLGCGFGDTTQRLAEIVGADGSAVGIDAGDRFVEVARTEADVAGTENVSFAVGDVQTASFDVTFDYAFSRFGTMFFASPVAALRNVREALVPGGRLCMVVWRRKLDNDWVHRAELVVEQFLTEPEDSDEPTCGPGPFSMANADTTCDILQSAGFVDVALRRSDHDYLMGRTLEEAVGLVMAIGPAAEIIRLSGDDAERIRPKLEAALLEALADFEGPDGVIGPSSSWVVTASAPAE